MAAGPDDTARPGAGALGGAANERGSGFRAAVGVWILAHALIGKAIPGIGTDAQPAIPTGTMLPESDAPVDDLEVALTEGTLFVQAKHRLNLSTDAESDFGKTVAQCCRQIQDRDLDPSIDRIAIAVGTSTGPLRSLQKALDRRRAAIAGAPTKHEAAAMGKLLLHIQGLDDPQRERLLGMLHVLILELDAPEAGLRERGEQWLARILVDPADAPRAFETLEARLKALAADRRGDDLDGWTATLRSAGFALRADDVTPSGRAEHLHRARTTYFDQLLERASSLDLDYLIPGCPPLTVAIDTAGPTVEVGGKTGTPLNWAQRRRGRVLLTGLPGVGKSTALRHLAAHHARSDSPLPLCAALPRVLDGQGNALERIVAEALRDMQLEDRRILATHAIHELTSTGRVLLLLDSLDECRDRAPEAIGWVRQALIACHDDVEVVLATRDSAYVAANSLVHDPKCQWSIQELRLEPPGKEAMKTRLRTVALEMSQHGEPPEPESSAAARVQWVLDQQDRASLRTPLAAWTLLALSETGLPDRSVSRGRLLGTLVEHLAERWELVHRRRGSLQLTASAADTRALVLLAFDIVGEQLSERGPLTRDELQAVVAAAFREEWGLLPGPAATSARGALLFWDEAGIFVGEGATQTVRPRLQVFSEIGHARRIARREPDQLRAWVEAASERDPLEPERLLLLAGLSATAARVLLQRACDLQRADVLALAARVVVDCEGTDEAIRARLASALLEAVDAPVQEHWQLVGAFLDIAPQTLLDETAEHRIRDVFGPERAQVFTMYAELRLRGDGGVEVESIRALPGRAASGRLPRATLGPGPRVLDTLGVDPIYERLVRQLAASVVPGDDDAAQAIIDRAGQISTSGFTGVQETLEARGFEGVVTAAWKSMASVGAGLDLLKQRTLDDLLWTLLLQSSIGRTRPPRDPWRAARRLDELTAFIRTLSDPKGLLRAAEVVLEHRMDLAERAVALVVELGGFDRSLLAAQLDAIQLPADRVALFIDAYGQDPRPLVGWQDGAEGARQLDDTFALLGPSSWLADIVVRALEAHPTPQAFLDRLSAFVRAPGSEDCRIKGAILLLARHPDPGSLLEDWRTGDDPSLERLALRVQETIEPGS